MQDGIIKGTGNSRMLKAPTTIPTTWDGFRAALITGTLPVDLLFNAAGWEVVGTLLGKANLLSDAVAALYGLSGTNATPNKALEAILAEATQSKKGLFSAADKTKLDGVATNANNYVHPTTAGNKHIPSGGANDQILGYSASGTAIWIQQLAEKALLSSTAANLYGVANVDAALAKILSPTLLQTYSTAGTYNYTVPTGVKWILAVIGGAGGGGGGGRYGGSVGVGGGGGGGGYITCVSIPVSPGQLLPIVVGAGGSPGAAGAANDGGDGGAGGTSAVNGITSQGGGGGAGGVSTSNSANGGIGSASGGKSSSNTVNAEVGGNPGSGLSVGKGFNNFIGALNRATNILWGAGGGGGGYSATGGVGNGAPGGTSPIGSGGTGGNGNGVFGAQGYPGTSGGNCAGGGGGGAGYGAPGAAGGGGGPGYIALYSIGIPLGL